MKYFTIIDQFLNRWWKLVAVSIIGIALIVSIIRVELKKQNDWNKFYIEHECKQISHESGSSSTGYGMTSNGNFGIITMTSPDKNCYICNDGITYCK